MLLYKDFTAVNIWKIILGGQAYAKVDLYLYNQTLFESQ